MIYSPISSPIRSAVSSLFANRGGFVPSRLFAAGEQGAWYDPSDWNTLYQDSAGTTPVTAVEQPVGRILDKSGRGNHAYQTTSTSRPVLSARYNLLTKTEQFDDAVWTKNNVTATQSSITDNSTVGGHYVSQTFFGAVIPTTSIATATAEFKAGTANYAYLALTDDGNRWFTAVADLSTGTITQTAVGTNSVLQSSSIIAIGGGWYRVYITGYAVVSGGFSNMRVGIVPAASGNVFAAGAVVSYAGSGSTILARNADARFTNAGTNLPAYQRVNTATDYDADPAKFKPYLKFDGVDDFLVTNSIDFTSTDKMTVFAGVRKLSDAAVGMVAELSASSTANNGAFALFAPNAASTYALRSKGTTDALITSAASYTSPITNVIAGIGDISGDSAILRINGAQVAQSTTDQGTGNFGNYPLYIGRRGGTTFPYNGQLYSLIVRGAATSGTQVSQTETWVNQRTGAY